MRFRSLILNRDSLYAQSVRRWHRLVRVADHQVTFTYKDYSQNGRRREMTLPVEEFIRRFLQHILSHRFVRIRYYGLLANRHRDWQLERCRALLGAIPPPVQESDEREDWEAVYRRVTGRGGRASVSWPV